MLEANQVYCGDSRELLKQIEDNSLALSFWSPPYFLGKDYEKGVTYEQWQEMLKAVIELHYRILKPGGFMVVNIADILAFQDETMPRIQADNPSNKKCAVTREMVLEAKRLHPDYNRDQLAAYLHCSEQTVDRRLNGNNIRGGRQAVEHTLNLSAVSLRNMPTIQAFTSMTKGYGSKTRHGPTANGQPAH